MRDLEAQYLALGSKKAQSSDEAGYSRKIMRQLDTGISAGTRY